MMWFAKVKHASWTKSCLDTKYVTRLFPNLDDYTTNWMGPPRYPTQRSERRIYIRTLDPSEGRKLPLHTSRLIGDPFRHRQKSALFFDDRLLNNIIR